MKFTAIKSGSSLVPTMNDEWDSIPNGAEVMVEYKKNRNPANHRRFFSFINTTFDMQEFWEDRDIYRKWLTMKAGYFKTVTTPKGSTIFIADSIAFDKMDENDFKELFSKVIDVFLKELGNGQTESDLMKVIGYA